MAEFKAIETQEELDAIISTRVNREKASHEATIKGLNEKISALEAEATKHSAWAEEKAKLEADAMKYRADLEKRDIAEEYGLPKGFYQRLQGESAEDWRKDAQALQQIVGNAGFVPPLATQEKGTGGADAQLDKAYRELNKISKEN